MIHKDNITGLVLAGGRGSRMGGVDKGLQLHRGQPLAWHALQRLAPQVGRTVVNANRHLEDYAGMGAPVWPDTLADQPGPLAGLLAGLQRCTSDYLVTVPCDSPRLPLDLVERLVDALVSAQGHRAAGLAVAATRGADGLPQLQPVFCLMHVGLQRPLAEHVAAGRRRVDRWMLEQQAVVVTFDDAAAFFNANTLQDLRQLDA
ncbi:MAG: molybdenum cofactor guanylyltransferase MobA [Burkholderiales bacterium]|jgi:molybdopterin-guanine dinucleotide biosynthesis protein A|nr:molybdenum cofactor guanylyltransferase MobA [Burkholderiales bacterium]MBP7520637.1 molybdenum cofactor guanylyltransferase MobA [Leptothrix sp. (in: b-proteobacteria)]